MDEWGGTKPPIFHSGLGGGGGGDISPSPSIYVTRISKEEDRPTPHNPPET